MREEGGRLVLLDFGAVDAPSITPLAREERGTPIAMAPEQLQCGPVGPASDLYGLGVLLYRLVTGRYPIEAETLAELAERHRSRTFVSLRDRRPDLPVEFVRVVERALDPVPAKRFASAGDMERALGALAHPWDPSRRGWWVAGVLAAASLMAVASLLAWMVFRFGSRSPGSNARPAPAAEPASSQPLSASAVLFMDRAGGPTPLRPGDPIAPGDALFLRLSSSEPVYAYVLDEDAKGALYTLFPVRGASPGNPLPAAAEHRLPGTIQGKPFDWQVTTAGGTESICVIASRAPLEAIESELMPISGTRPHAPVSFAKVPGGAADRLRGLGGMTEAIAPDSSPRDRLAALIRELRARPRASDIPWIWEMTLENPGGRSR